MAVNETFLTKQEQRWLLEKRVTRLTDNKEVQIYPMGAERYLAAVLLGNKPKRYNISADIKGKNVLVIPGYGNSSFLFAQAGAASIRVYDKDPVTIAWMKAFKKYYHYREQHSLSKSYPSIGELFKALTCWYPPLITLPSKRYRNSLLWGLNPNRLRRAYILYMLDLVEHALKTKPKGNFELDADIQFYAGTIDKALTDNQHHQFDTAFVPYLLGIKNGIEQEQQIINFIKKLFTLIPKGRVLINPCCNTKEFYLVGKRYLLLTSYKSIQAIPTLRPYVIAEDKYWLRTQGLAVLALAQK